MQLRPYQDDALNGVRSALKDANRVLLVSPTGSGKTVMFSYMASRASMAGRTVGIFAHRVELIKQISRTLKQFGVAHGIIAAGTTFVPGHRVYVCSAQTYAKRADRMPVFDLGIVDEAHHATTGSTWGACMTRSPNAKWVGVTATPERLDGRGLGESFEAMVLGPTPRTLIDLGALADYRLFAPATVDISGVHTLAGEFNRAELAAAVDKPGITGDAVRHYRDHLKGAPSIAFCVSIAHAEHVAEQFRAAGYTSASVDGKLDMAERERRMADFAGGGMNVLTSCDLISEGLDVPGIHGAILLRPTQSLGLYLQQVGRALRPAPGKPRAVIMDHAGNWKLHGLPDAEREWSLDARARSKRERDPTSVRMCEQCYAAFPAVQSKCPECGWMPAVAPRKIDTREGELVEVDAEAVRLAKVADDRIKSQAAARTLEGLIALGHSAGRAQHIIAAREEKEQLRRRLIELTGIHPLAIRDLKPKALREEIAKWEMADVQR